MKNIRIHVILAALILAVTGVSVGAAQSAIDQLQASQAAMDDFGRASPPSVPDQWPHAKDLNTANKAFMAWQVEMFKEREEIARRQARLLHDRMKVPPPLPTSQVSAEISVPESLADLGTKIMRLDVPLPLIPTDAQLTLFFGEPSASFNVGAEAKALSFAGASYKAGVAYSATDNKWLVGDSKDIKLAYNAGPAEIVGTYQYHSSTWTQPARTSNKGPAGIELSADLGMVKGALGYNTQNELSLTLGRDLLKTPKALSFLAEASIGVEGQVSAPVVVHGLTRGKLTLSSRLMDYSIKATKLLTRPIDCPWCAAKGQLDCSTCKNVRTITCPKCNGKLRFSCPTCKGGGELYCPNCNHTGSESCGGCNGTGQLRCSGCGGSGSVTTYESETQSRQVRKLINVGFNENGQPFEEWGWETEYYTVQVSKSQTCGSCSGSGRGGECGTCGGSGKVTCRRCGGSTLIQCYRCKGSGQVNCGTCHGTGKVTCPECRGKPIKCPLCRGKQQLGK